MPSFSDIKAAYKEARNEEKKKLIDVLTHRGYAANNRGGCGFLKYTNNSTIKTYDFTNWMWLNGRKTLMISNNPVNLTVTVYFQSPNYDNRTKNNHILFDRLCYSISLKGKSKLINDVINEVIKSKYMFLTSYDLPLNKSDYALLVDDIEKKISDTINSIEAKVKTEIPVK